MFEHFGEYYLIKHGNSNEDRSILNIVKVNETVLKLITLRGPISLKFAQPKLVIEQQHTQL